MGNKGGNFALLRLAKDGTCSFFSWSPKSKKKTDIKPLSKKADGCKWTINKKTLKLFFAKKPSNSKLAVLIKKQCRMNLERFKWFELPGAKTKCSKKDQCQKVFGK